MQRLARFKAELEMLNKNPPPGIHCWQDDDSSETIKAELSGPPGSPYEKGHFIIEVTLSDRYPFTPPLAKFLTPIYHPNIDPSGRICLTALKPKPTGTWSVTLNIPTILSAIRVLLSEPNLSDPLMVDIAKEFLEDYPVYRSKAEAATMEHAVKKMA